MRFLHTADWQLGMTRHFLSAGGGEAQSRYAARPPRRRLGLGALAAGGRRRVRRRRR